MPLALRAGIAAAAILAATSGAAPAPDRVEYYLINGPEYRQVSEAVFDEMHDSCMRIENKRYPEDHLIQRRCYL